MNQLVLILFASFGFAVPLSGQVAEKPPKPLTPKGIRQWHKAGGLNGWKGWPREIKLDICGDDQPELFLGVGGFSRGISYAVFTRTHDSWHMLADSVDCTAGMLDVLSTQRDGHYDFAAFQRSGRGGFLVRVYSWDGHHYGEKVNWEMSHGDLYNTGR